MATWVALSRIAMLCNRAEFQTGQEQVPVLKRFELILLLLLSFFFLSVSVLTTIFQVDLG